MVARHILLLILLFGLSGPIHAESGLLDEAIRAFNQGDFSSAIDKFSAIVDGSDASMAQAARAYSNRGRSYLAMGEFRKAREDLDEAIRLNPELAAAWLSRGQLNRAEGELDAAIADFSSLIEYAPELAVAYNLRGDAYYEKVEFDKAIQDYDQAVNMRPQNPVYYYNRGLAYHEKGDYEFALLNYNEALNLSPEFAAAYRYRALLHSVSGNFKQAIQDLDAVLGLNPKSVLIHQLRGYNRFFSGDFGGASEDFATVLKAIPGSVNAAVWAYIAAGRAGLDGAELLNALGRDIDTASWPGVLVDYVRGNLSVDQVLEGVQSKRTIERAERQAQARFYIGQIYLIKGDIPMARQNFEATAAATGIDGFIEFRAAQT